MEVYLTIAAIVFVGYCLHGLSYGGGAGLVSALPVAAIMGVFWPVTILRFVLAFFIGSALKKVIPDRPDPPTPPPQ